MTTSTGGRRAASSGISSVPSTLTSAPHAPDLDGILITWGDRLFYPGNRIVQVRPQPKLAASGAHQRANAIRQRIEATVVRRAPQVMVKVTGGGRSMAAIAAHFRYISKNGRLEIEDQRGESMQGKHSLHHLADEWRMGGARIPEDAEPGQRREAFNIMLSMPRGTDPLIVQRAAREVAQAELSDHKYVMVLHDHQANPHVHISVRAVSRLGKRLNPRKNDLHRWRETFAEKLRGYGVEAEATRQTTRGQQRAFLVDLLVAVGGQRRGQGQATLLRHGRCADRLPTMDRFHLQLAGAVHTDLQHAWGVQLFAQRAQEFNHRGGIAAPAVERVFFNAGQGVHRLHLTRGWSS